MMMPTLRMNPTAADRPPDKVIRTITIGTAAGTRQDTAMFAWGIMRNQCMLQKSNHLESDEENNHSDGQ